MPVTRLPLFAFLALLAVPLLGGCRGNAGPSVPALSAYRITVAQGNILDAADLSRLERGMDRERVRLLLGTPLAWWLAGTRSPFKPLIEAVTALPLVLPPTVLGSYLLVLFAPDAPLGGLWVELTGQTLTFSFSGLVLASMLYSLPFVVQPLQASFEAIGRGPLEAAAVLGARPLDVFFSVASPLALRGYLTATVLGFAHTLGEFGVVLMVGGNIPERTRVISIAI